MESQDLNTVLWGSLVVGEATVASAAALKITGQPAAPGLSGKVAAMMAADTTTWVVAAILLAIMGEHGSRGRVAAPGAAPRRR